MATNAEDVAVYLQNALLQVGAESYLHDIPNFQDRARAIAAWKYGSNDASHPFIDPTYVGKDGIRGRAAQDPNDPGVPFGADKAVLPGYNRMVQVQADKLFNDGYEIIDHHANDATGFSATLYGKRLQPENSRSEFASYTLSFRSTESRPWEVAGDAERDAKGANTEGIYKRGYAFAQLASMEEYWRHIRAGESWDGKTWSRKDKSKLAAFGDYMKNSQKEFYVTGHSLGGHLATAFTLMHESDVKTAYTFNGAGVGKLIDPQTGQEAAGARNGEVLRGLLAAFSRALLDPAGVTPTWHKDSPLQQLRDDAIRFGKGDPHPFITESGHIHSDGAPRGDVYKGDRYDFALAYATSMFPTATLAQGPLAAVFGVGLPSVIKGLFSQLDAGNYESFGRGIEAARGSTAVVGEGFDKIVSIAGQATHDDFQGVVDSQRHTANKLSVFVEDQADIFGKGGFLPIRRAATIAKEMLKNKDGGPGAFASSHGLILLIDSLSLVKAIQEIAPDASLETIQALMAASSNMRGESNYSFGGTANSHPGVGEGDSLEQLLDAFRRILLAPSVLEAKLSSGTFDTPFDRKNDSFGNFRNRTQYHNNLLDLQARGERPNYTLEGLLTSGEGRPDDIARGAAPKSAASIKEIARGADARALAYRYALTQLNAFALVGGDLYADKNANGELNLVDPAASGSNRGHLTMSWLDDRTEMLRRKAILNLDNLNNDLSVSAVLKRDDSNINSKSNSSPAANPLHPDNEKTALFRNEAVVYDDRASGYRIDFRVAGANRRIVFGGESTDELRGGALDDRLYGGGGTDWLEGLGGADRLEGGTGLDLYQYNGAAAAGGTNDGADDVFDADGKGVLRYTFTGTTGGPESTVIADASVYISANEWQSADGRFTYTRTGNDLTVSINGDAGGTLKLENWREGDYGIRLRAPREAPAFADEVTGDLDENKDDTLYGGRPSGEVAPTAPGAKVDGKTGNDFIFADRNEGEATASAFGNADWVIGGEGRDAIEAGAGDDLVEAGGGGVSASGEPGGDIVDGGAGNDALYANAALLLKDAILAGGLNDGTALKGDFLSGGAGDDWLVGATTMDTLMGGEGKDVLVGGAGDDNLLGDDARTAQVLTWTAVRSVTIQGTQQLHRLEFTGLAGSVAGPGDADTIHGGRGEDWILAGGGDDFVDGGADRDVMWGDAGADVLVGGGGDDILVGDSGPSAAPGDAGDYLDGGSGDDSLEGNGGDDILIGGAGRDTLQGGAGKDIYVFNRGDAYEDETVFDPAGPGDREASVVVLGEGIRRDDIKLRKGSLLLDIGNSSDPNAPHDRIHFEGFDALNPAATRVIGEIRFTDGSVMTYEDILEQGFEIDGTEGDDFGQDAAHPELVGTAVGDRIRGFAGRDNLIGLSGEDMLDGGTGNDLLQGGLDRDTYVLRSGDGFDELRDPDLDNVVRFGEGISSASLAIANFLGFDPHTFTLLRYSDVTYGTQGDRLRIVDGVYGRVGRYEFADGSSLTHEELMQRAAAQDVSGGEEADRIAGSEFADGLLGYGGDDAISGQGGDDYIDGWIGDDALHGGAGRDQVRGGPGEDVLSGGAGEDALYGEAGFDALDGGEGADFLDGGEEADQLSGGAGADRLFGREGDDELAGGEGDDLLEGGAGADVLAGGEGADVLAGGAGDDTYLVNSGDGADRIADDDGANTVTFGEGIDFSGVTVSQYAGDDGREYLSFSYSGGTLDIADGALGRVRSFVFEDGERSLRELVAGASALDVRGTPLSEQIYGSNQGDELFGAGGDDFIDAQAGADVLDGGAGADVLSGGLGTDTYRFGLGGGLDTISEEEGESSVLALGPGLLSADLAAERAGDDLQLSRRGADEGVTILGYYAQNHAWTLRDAQGAEQDLASFLQGAPGPAVDPMARFRALAHAHVVHALGARGQGSYQLRADGKYHLERTETQPYHVRSTHRIAEVRIEERSATSSSEFFAAGSWSSAQTGYVQTTTTVTVRPEDASIRHSAGAVNRDPVTRPFFYASGAGFSGFRIPAGATVVQVHAPDGSLRGFWVYPQNTAPAGGTGGTGSSTATATRIDETFSEILTFDQVIAGNGANTVTLNGYAILNAGGGDDIVTGADPQFWSARADAETSVASQRRDPLEFGPNLIYGGDGNDTLLGGRAGDVINGGAGADFLNGQGGADTYYVETADEGIDFIEDDGAAVMFYGGRVEAQGAETWAFREWFYGRVGYDGTGTPPTLPASNDFAAWEGAYGTDLINADRVRFGAGVTPESLAYAWGEATLRGHRVATLDLTWGPGKGVRVAIPRAGDTIGSGMELFEFDDGRVLTMRQMIERAPAAPDFDFGTVTDGAGDDVFFGLEGAETYAGGDGADFFSGNQGDDTAYGGAGDDTLNGGGDSLWWYWGYLGPAVEPTGNDVLYGGDGNDSLNGGDGSNLLEGGAGDDAVNVSGGSDFVAGGTGVDTIDGHGSGMLVAFRRGDGNDTLRALDGTTLSLGGGIGLADLTFTRSGADLILGLGGGESLRLADWYAYEPDYVPTVQLQILGADARAYALTPAVQAYDAERAANPGLSDWAAAGALGQHEFFASDSEALGGQLAYDYAIAGTTTLGSASEARAVLSAGVSNPRAFSRRVIGTARSDTLSGTAGSDFLIGGAGHDTLDGGAGDDVYLFNPGDGVDTISDASGEDSVRFGAGIRAEDLSLGLGSLLIRVGASGDALRLESFDAQNALGEHDIEHFVFADGTSLTYAELVARGFDIAGTAADEALSGTNVDDRISGLLGDDLLAGGHGNDTYYYAAGDGRDALDDLGAPGDIDLLSLGEGLAPVATSVRAEGADVLLAFFDGGAVRLSGQLAGHGVEYIGFDDGTYWTRETIAGKAAPQNNAPVLSAPLADQAATEDAAFSFQVPEDAFADPDAGQTLSLTAGLADGSALPDWLVFDAEGRVLSGTPGNADVGAYQIQVVATDAAGASVADVFTLDVVNVNDVPVLAQDLLDHVVDARAAFSFALPEAAFNDPDTGDSLAISAALYGGGSLPAWLSFDVATRTFRSTAQAANVGISHIAVTATDTAGATATADFGLVVRVAAGASETGGVGDDVLVGNTGDETLIARGGSDYAYGDAGNDLLRGGSGNDVLQGGAGSDVIRGGAGQNVLDGGAGDDLIYGGQGSAFILGGAGNDTLRVGRGSDVIGFNAGDGVDTIYGGRDGGNTLSFGGGIGYQDLALSKEGKDLVVNAGDSDKVILKNWYNGNQSVAKLQVMLDASEEFDATSSDTVFNKKVQTFDFLALVSAFDAARGAQATATQWQIVNGYVQAHLWGSDDEAIGGDLAYWYSRNRTVAGIGLAAAQALIGGPGFGADAQSLRPFTGLQEGLVKLA